jgi:hypothetical protein
MQTGPALPMPYRSVPYSIFDDGDGHVNWKLHPKLESNVWNYIVSGVAETRDSALVAIKTAIDNKLGPVPRLVPYRLRLTAARRRPRI